MIASKNEAASRQPVTDCNRFGNVDKMREALRGLLEIVCIDCNSSYKVDGKCVKCPRVVAAECALSAPPRNCDVGTPEDQHNRFMRFCDSKSMGYCWGRGCRKCMAQWGQIPYEGENEEVKK